jgi:hypothetical protein
VLEAAFQQDPHAFVVDRWAAQVGDTGCPVVATVFLDEGVQNVALRLMMQLARIAWDFGRARVATWRAFEIPWEHVPSLNVTAWMKRDRFQYWKRSLFVESLTGLKRTEIAFIRQQTSVLKPTNLLLGELCSWVVKSMTEMIRAPEHGGMLPWKYQVTPFEKAVDPSGVTTEFVRWPDSTASGIVNKVKRTALPQ